ncbi:MAG: hemerythrin domain-containing protein [Acidobacteria bacterium]|nr:hemerythrin domain-containing protein [Acidobacteriota bacterium]
MIDSATTVLKKEHQVILRVLTCLEAMADEAEQSGNLAIDDARDAVRFLREFADDLHHAKEERRLFPAMEAAGYPREGGPTGVMIAEHEQCRAHNRGMNAALDGEANADAVRSYVEHARGFVATLRQHIEKEDHCLFSMADQSVAPAVLEQLANEFHAYNLDAEATGTSVECVAIADRLSEKYGVVKQSDAAHMQHAGCGHH